VRRSFVPVPTKLFAWLVPAIALVALLALRAGGVDVTELPLPQGSMTYTDRNGEVLGTVLGADSARAAEVTLNDVSPAFLDAIVAAEDGRFWQHGAIDLFALARASRDLAIYGQAHSGGSTIAMQLARLTGETVAPSGIDAGIGAQLGAKILQIWGAQRIAIASEKRAILEAYINRVPMGGNVYGVEAAARTYFGEPASDLDLAQAAVLAAIPNDPSRLGPDGTDWTWLRERQRFVLRRMVELGFVTAAQAEFAGRETLHFRRNDSGIADAAHALFFLARNAPPHGGRTRTTIELSLQRFVQAQAEDVVAALARYRVADAAALVVDNRSGDVLAYVGSPDYFSNEVLGRNDGVQALRQPGSSLKPFTYELALERGAIRSTTILDDAPVSYAISAGKLYQPTDYSGRFSGPVRVRVALANSLNAPAVQVLSTLGVGELLDRLHELGFAHLDRPASYYGLGLTLGSGEVSLWELVQAYCAIARAGSVIPLRLVAGDAPAARVVGQAAYWQLVTDMLADPQARAKAFGIGSVLQMPFPAAVKTGTSSDFRDTWTIGFTRDYTVGTWVGNFDGSPMRGVSGVTGAGPLWNRIMLHLYEPTAEPPSFPPPRGFVRRALCATTGHSPGPNCPGIVQEWILPRDLARLRHRDGAPVFRIVFPRSGDIFVQNRTTGTLEAREQQLVLRATGAHARIRWSIEGSAIPLDRDGNAFWPLRLGTWRIIADDGSQRDSVTIRVVPSPRQLRPGFTLLRE